MFHAIFACFFVKGVRGGVKRPKKLKISFGPRKGLGNASFEGPRTNLPRNVPPLVLRGNSEGFVVLTLLKI